MREKSTYVSLWRKGDENPKLDLRNEVKLFSLSDYIKLIKNEIVLCRIGSVLILKYLF